MWACCPPSVVREERDSKNRREDLEDGGKGEEEETNFDFDACCKNAVAKCSVRHSII